MHYLPDDAFWVTSGLQFRVLGRPEFLADMDLAGQQHAQELAEYPQRQYDALEQHYLSLRGMAALDLCLLHDLLFELTPQQSLAGAWFAALSPHPLYEPLLREARARALNDERYQRAQARLLALALAAYEESDVVGDAGSDASCMQRIREALAPLPKPMVLLRLMPTPEQLQQLQEDRQRVGQIYRRHGAQAARDAIPGTVTGFFNLSHAAWRRLGYPSMERYLQGGRATP